MSWELLFSAALYALNKIEKRRNCNHERATLALDALGSPFHATSAYYESEFSSDSDRRNAQYDLAEKWDRVANLMRPFDTALWSRFNLKSRFWREGGAWSDEQIQSAKIGLESVRRDARFALIPKQRSANG